MQDRPLLEGIPRIGRARGFRLYDVQGRRYLDLSRDEALLGHRAAGVHSVMKSVLSQGLSSPLPTAWEGRCEAAGRRVRPGWAAVRLFSSPDRALQAAGQALGESLSWEDVHDPAVADPPDVPPHAALWRPFLPVVAGCGALLLKLPFTICGAPMPVCFAAGPPVDDAGSDPIPGFVLAGALRGLSALARPAVDARPGVDALECAIDRAKGWRRRGPYVHAVFPSREYPRVHLEFLREGVLLFPGYPGPSVLPGECSPGETRLLARLFARIPGG
jgi:hypothetical protein